MEKKMIREEAGYTLYRLENTVELGEYLKECVDIPKFEAMCRSCPNYGNRWSCPPFDFDPMEIWGSFDTLRLVTHILEPKAGQTVSDVLAAHQQEKGRMLTFLMECEQEHPGGMALWAGTCDLCPVCAKSEGQPCRMPERMRHSIEALGGDVGKTCDRYFGYPILWIEGDRLPAYMTLMGGILYKK